MTGNRSGEKVCWQLDLLPWHREKYKPMNLLLLQRQRRLRHKVYNIEAEVPLAKSTRDL
jgi:hypothetical protein